LMARCAFDEATLEERLLLQEMLQKDTALQQQYDWLVQLIEAESQLQTAEFSTANNSKLEKIFSKAALLDESRSRKSFPFGRKFWWAAAASLVLSLSIYGTLFLWKPEQNKVVSFTAIKKVGQLANSREPMVLPDGTKVWLNEGSTLKLENNFSGNTREVTLFGEGFFDVTKNASKPFIVHVNKVNINVLGTAFNVKGYEEDKDIQTTLYRGLIRITKNNDDHFQPIMVYPNQKIVIPKSVISSINHSGTQTDAITLLPVDSTITEAKRVETAWIYGRIDFKAEALFEVANKLAHRYQVKFVFDDEKVKQLHFTGSFEQESLDNALRALKTANAFNYKINKNEVLISSVK